MLNKYSVEDKTIVYNKQMLLTHIRAIFHFLLHFSTIREISGATWALFVTSEISMLHSGNFLVFYSLVACKYRDRYIYINIYTYIHHAE